MSEPNRKRAKELDDALSGRTPADEEAAALAEAGRAVERAVSVEVPPAPRQRALFVSGAATRRSSFGFGRIAAPIVAAVAVIVLAVIGGRTALPGETLYPVREALGRVGLATPLADVADRHIESARGLILRARNASGLSPTLATDLAVRALKELGVADHFVDRMRGEAKAIREQRIAALTDGATNLLARTTVGAPGFDDDSSGPGGGDDADDSSGPGSGDEDEDNSGPGSGDEDSDGDSSGPGSGDEDEDNSGPG